MNPSTMALFEIGKSDESGFDWRRVVVVALILLFFVGLAIAFTRPLLWEGGSATLAEPYDPMLNAWTLKWDLRQLAHNPLNLFNANIYFPNRYTLAYSEQQIVTAVLSLPAMGLTGNPIAAMNFMTIFHFFLCSLGAYLLVTHLTKNRLAGVAAGVAFAYAPYKLTQMLHLPMLAAGFIPLTLLFLHRYCEDGRVSDAALAALFLVLQVLSTWYYGFMLAVAVLVFLVVRLIVNRLTFTLKWTLVLAGSLVIAAALIVPFALPYLKVRQEEPRFERKVEEVDLFSADLQDFGAAPAASLVWGRLTRPVRENTSKRGGPSERCIFPGLVPLVLGIGGAVYLFRRRYAYREGRFWFWYYVPLLVISVVLALGTSLYLFGRRFDIYMPYEFLYRFFPGFKALRVPARFSIFIALSLAVLGGFAVKGVYEWFRKGHRARTAVLACLLLVALLCVDLMSAPATMASVPKESQFPMVYHWLKQQEGEAPTVEVPLALYRPRTFEAGLQYEATWLGFESWRTYYSTLHWKKLVNGYSGYIPETYYQAVKACRRFPSDEAMRYLKALGVRFIIVHERQLGPTRTLAMERWDRTHRDIKKVWAYGYDTVYEFK